MDNREDDIIFLDDENLDKYDDDIKEQLMAIQQ